MRSLLLASAMLATLATQGSSEPVPYILDTDIASDCDDAGALAAANAFHALGEARLLAVMVSTGGDAGAPAVAAINAWYGHGDIPVGTLKDPAFWVGGSPDAPSGASNYQSYSPRLAAEFPTPLRSGADAPDARVLYRRTLAAQPDHSVVVNTIGPLINLHHLLRTGPDEHSPLDGMALVRTKVRKLVVCGGRNPEGTSSNFSKAGAGPYAQDVIHRWPTPIVFVGNEVGGNVQTGWSRNADATRDHPARAAYRHFHGGHDLRTRASWDQAGVLYAIRGLGDLYELVEGGYQECDAKGQTRWLAGEHATRQHAYLRKKPDINGRLRDEIETLMTLVPPARTDAPRTPAAAH